MSKKGTYHAPFFNEFSARLHGTHISFGFLIGTNLRDGQRDVVFAAPTPPEPTEEGTEEERSPRDIAATLKAKGSSKTQFCAWAVQHLEALRKLLPGNLEPCGCFLGVSETVAKDLAPSLVPVLKSITEPLLLTFDGKLAFWNHCSEGAKVSLRPAQLKPETHKDALMIWSSTLIDFVAPCSRDSEEGADHANSLVVEAEAALKTAMQNRPIAVAAGSNAPMRIVSLSDEAPVSNVSPKGCSELQAVFLNNGSPMVCISNPEGRPCFRQRCLVVSVVLLLRRDMELRQVLEDLRKATVASAKTRLQLALEEADGAPGKVDLPWRALCRPQDVELPVWCGDYCMPDEGVETAQERLGELLGSQAFDVAPANLDEQALLQQHCPNSYKHEPAPAKGGMSQKGPSKSSNLGPTLACAIAVGALLIAVAIPLVLRM